MRNLVKDLSVQQEITGVHFTMVLLYENLVKLDKKLDPGSDMGGLVRLAKTLTEAAFTALQMAGEKEVTLFIES